jgi:hypothetical protein
VSQGARAGLLVAVVAALCAGSIGGVIWYRARNARPAALMSRMPVREAVVVYIDFAALRRSGLLQMLGGARTAEEPEYQQFVRRTRFNYQQDLDSALVAFAPRAKYFLLRGRFDWTALRNYAAAENGACKNSLCRMPGSTPERRISFFPVESDIMALAVSPDQSAAWGLSARGALPGVELPDAPVWISLPPAVLRSGAGLPTGTRMFARGIENAEGATLSIGPDGQRFAARLKVRCQSESDAAATAAELGKTTALLGEMIAREHQKPNPADLSGVLTAGAFRSEGRSVAGYWPIERAFLDNLLAGGNP